MMSEVCWQSRSCTRLPHSHHIWVYLKCILKDRYRLRSSQPNQADLLRRVSLVHTWCRIGARGASLASAAASALPSTETWFRRFTMTLPDQKS